MPRPSPDEACTKIVATVGPACSTVEKLVQLIDGGVDVFRINTAHGSREEHETALANIRDASNRSGHDVGVLLDLSGPKIRLGQIADEPLVCEHGMSLDFVRGDESSGPHELTSNYRRLVDELKVGDRVMLADGTVSLNVERVSPNRVGCRVTAAGEVRSRQGINLPGVRLSVSAMRPEDVDNAIWGAKSGVDFISLSFVRSAADVQSLRNLLASYDSTAMVIAKIEKREALENLMSIVEVADGVMVARGDLGVEIDVAETPVAQKRIIQVCKEKMKPVIVATQMLESMHHSKRPTRAEASDVANAILDGADACMLSGETAIGDYPLEAVTMMNGIMICTERELLSHNIADRRQSNRVHPVTSAVTHAATNIAESIGAKLIVIVTASGNTAWVKSGSRSLIPTLGVSENPDTIRRMNLFWGIKPVSLGSTQDTSELVDRIDRWGREHVGLEDHDHVVLVTGSGIVARAHNNVMVHTLGESQ